MPDDRPSTPVQAVLPKVRCLRAPNPSPMTGPGTNTYLIGQGAGVVVLDPGPQIPAHLHALQDALRHDQVAAIVVSHAHLDHSAAARDLATLTGAPLLAYGGALSGRSALMADLVAAGLDSGGEGLDLEFQPDDLLRDGDEIPSSAGALRVWHTPGHLGGHLCLSMGGVLFSGDHAMGWSSSLVSPPDGDMGAYIRSLQRLLQQDWQMMLSGHGDPVLQAAARLQHLLAHRQDREAQILQVLNTGAGTCRDLAAQVYHDTPAALMPAAERNTLAHLIDLWDRKQITCPSLPGRQAIFARSSVG